MKKTVKRPALRTKKKSSAKKVKRSADKMSRPAKIVASPIHGTAGGEVPEPSRRLFTNTRRDARIAFKQKADS